jgi:hypothetical protein
MQKNGEVEDKGYMSECSLSFEAEQARAGLSAGELHL